MKEEKYIGCQMDFTSSIATTSAEKWLLAISIYFLNIILDTTLPPAIKMQFSWIRLLQNWVDFEISFLSMNRKTYSNIVHLAIKLFISVQKTYVLRMLLRSKCCHFTIYYSQNELVVSILKSHRWTESKSNRVRILSKQKQINDVWHLISETRKNKIGQKKNGSKINIYYANIRSENIFIFHAVFGCWCVANVRTSLLRQQ